MNYLNTQAQIRPCGSGWEYCDGICNGCFKRKTINSTTTYPKYSYNSGLCYSDGKPCYGEDLDSLFQEVENDGR